MNKILLEIRKIMNGCVEEYIADITFDDLEENGAVYYMNGKNGTEFDWYVNDKLSDFMMFYNDKNNMGAVKATLYYDGSVLIYVYGDKGEKLIQEIKSHIDAEPDTIMKLAVVLKNEADEKRIWDDNIQKIDTDSEPDKVRIDEFLSNSHYYDDMRERKALMGKMAYVSKKIMDEGWKVGYMRRDEAVQEYDSGWSFMAGNESDEYTADYQNIQLMSVHAVMQYDMAIWKYINSPVGTSLIRISSDEFEIDNNDKEIYMEKR